MTHQRASAIGQDGTALRRVRPSNQDGKSRKGHRKTWERSQMMVTFFFCSITGGASNDPHCFATVDITSVRTKAANYLNQTLESPLRPLSKRLQNALQPS